MWCEITKMQNHVLRIQQQNIKIYQAKSIETDYASSRKEINLEIVIVLIYLIT